MSYPNGYVPSSALDPLPGSNSGLLKPAAFAYKAMHYASVKAFGIPLTIIDGQVGRTYRSYYRQVLAKRIYGSNAAWPGTSNHGLALAVDLLTKAQRWAIDKIGRQFGWAKIWSDAIWEWWHLKWRWGSYHRRPDPLRKLGKRQRAAAERLLYHRRERRREAHSGRGKRWHRQNGWVEFWYRRVARLHHRASGARKQVLHRVLVDRDGNI